MKATLDHVGIAVTDLAAALSFYRDALGLAVSPPETIGRDQVRASFVATGGATLELLEAASADSPVGRFTARRGPGLHHITLAVDDLSAALGELEARGVRLIDQTPRPGAHGALVAFVHPASTHGVLVELTERRPAAEAAGTAATAGGQKAGDA
jgi:methylmalonyl-CoA/ethylmalonyl-CoA epimerase